MIDPISLAQTTASVPFLASRVFQCGFAAAALARISHEVDWAWLSLVRDLPSWTHSDLTLVVLGILALLELLATKDPDARRVLGVFDAEMKGAAQVVFATVLQTGFIGLGTRSVEPLEAAAITTPQMFLALGTGIAVWGVAKLRQGVLDFFAELDEDDDLGLQRLLSWAEDGWSMGGIVLVLLAPILALVVAGMTLLALWLVRRWVDRREAKLLEPCPHCGERRHPSAVECPACRQTLPQPRQVGVLGQASQVPVTDIAVHRRMLTARKRCSSCATRLPKKTVRQPCSRCATETFASRAAVDDHLTLVKQRLPQTLLTCWGLSFVPILGLIPGILYYRLGLVSRLRCYVSPVNNFLGRWMVRLITLLLLLLQPIPILGSAVLPLMAFTNYRVYRGMLEKQRDTAFPS